MRDPSISDLPPSTSFSSSLKFSFVALFLLNLCSRSLVPCKLQLFNCSLCRQQQQTNADKLSQAWLTSGLFPEHARAVLLPLLFPCCCCFAAAAVSLPSPPPPLLWSAQGAGMPGNTRARPSGMLSSTMGLSGEVKGASTMK